MPWTNRTCQISSGNGPSDCAGSTSAPVARPARKSAQLAASTAGHQPRASAHSTAGASASAAMKKPEDVELPRPRLERHDREREAQRAVERVEVRAGRARRDRQRLGRQAGHEREQPDERRRRRPTRGRAANERRSSAARRRARRRASSQRRPNTMPTTTPDTQHERLGGRQERLGHALERRVEVHVVDDEDHDRQAAHEVERDVALRRPRDGGGRAQVHRQVHVRVVRGARAGARTGGGSSVVCWLMSPESRSAATFARAAHRGSVVSLHAVPRPRSARGRPRGRRRDGDRAQGARGARVADRRPRPGALGRGARRRGLGRGRAADRREVAAGPPVAPALGAAATAARSSCATAAATGSRSTPTSSTPPLRAARRRGRAPPRRRRRSSATTRRSRSCAGARTPTSRSSTAWPPRSGASTSCGCARSRAGCARCSSSAATPRRCPSSSGVVRDEPHHEAFAALHMLALYRAGRQVEALEAYRAHRRRSCPSSASSRPRSCAGSSGDPQHDARVAPAPREARARTSPRG